MSTGPTLTLVEGGLVKKLRRANNRKQESSAVHQSLIQNGDPTNVASCSKYCDSEQKIETFVLCSILCATVNVQLAILMPVYC